MKNTIKWVLEEIRNDGIKVYLSKSCNRHGHDVVDFDSEYVLFLQTREIARNYKNGVHGKFMPKKVTMMVS